MFLSANIPPVLYLLSGTIQSPKDMNLGRGYLSQGDGCVTINGRSVINSLVRCFHHGSDQDTWGSRKEAAAENSRLTNITLSRMPLLLSQGIPPAVIELTTSL